MTDTVNETGETLCLKRLIPSQVEEEIEWLLFEESVESLPREGWIEEQWKRSVFGPQ